MIDHIRKLLAPPQVEDLQNASFDAMFNTVLFYVAAGLLISFVPLLLSSPHPEITILIYLIVAISLAVTAGLMRRGYRQTAGLLIVVSMAVIVTWVNLIWGGLANPRMGGYFILIVGSGMALGKRGVLFGALLSAGSALLQFVVINGGQLATPVQLDTPHTALWAQLAQFLIFSLVLYVVIAMVADSIKKTRTSEQALRSALNDLQTTSISRNVLRSITSAVIITDHEMRIRAINPAALKMLRYREEEVIGKPLTSVCRVPMPEGENDTLIIGPATSSNATVYNGEAILTDKTGKQLHVHLTQSMLYDDHKHMTGLVCLAQDVSEQQHIEIERMQNAMRYRALFEQANDAIFLIDLRGQHIAVNKRALDMLGYTREVLMDMPHADLIAVDEHHLNASVLKDLNDGKVVPVHERAMRRADGSLFTAEINVELVRDATGKPLHVQNIVRDITERKRNEELMAYQADLLRNVSDAIISTDLDSVILSWNHAAERLYGWKESEVKGKQFDDLVQLEDGNKLIRTSKINRGYWRSEVKHRTKSGDILHILTSTSVLRDKSGKVTGIVIVNHDITARKKAEEALETRVSQLATLREIDERLSSTLNMNEVLRIGLNATFKVSNADSGFVPLADGSMETIGDIDPENDAQALVERAALKMELVYERDEPRYRVAIPLVSNEQLLGVIVVERHFPFTDETLEFLKIIAPRIAVALDNARLYQVSQEHLLELKKVYEDVKNLEELKTDMIRIGSHDIRGPIGLIRVYTDFFRNDAYDRLTEEELDHLGQIEKAAERVASISTDLLSLERIEQIAAEPFAEVFDFNALLREIIVQIAPNAVHKDLTMAVDLAEMETWIHGDSLQIREATSNLIENAIKYTPSGGHINVSLHVEDQCVAFRVRDTGFGIKEDDQRKMFKPFSRARSHETRNIEGNGLGLYLVRRIVERHNGQILFHSVYGEGSTFGFAIPMQVEA